MEPSTHAREKNEKEAAPDCLSFCCASFRLRMDALWMETHPPHCCVGIPCHANQGEENKASKHESHRRMQSHEAMQPWGCIDVGIGWGLDGDWFFIPGMSITLFFFLRRCHWHAVQCKVYAMERSHSETYEHPSSVHWRMSCGDYPKASINAPPPKGKKNVATGLNAWAIAPKVPLLSRGVRAAEAAPPV